MFVSLLCFKDLCFLDLLNICRLPTRIVCDNFHLTIDFLYMLQANTVDCLEVWKDHFRALPTALNDFGGQWRPI